MAQNYSADKTDRFIDACEKGNIAETLFLLNDKETDINATNVQGHDFLSILVMNAKKTNINLGSVMEKILNNKRVNGNKELLRGKKGYRVNLVDLLEGKFPKYKKELEGLDIAQLKTMTSQALKGKTVSKDEVRKKTPSLKESFLKNPTVQKFIAGGVLAMTLVCGAKAIDPDLVDNVVGKSSGNQEEVNNETTSNKIEKMLESGDLYMDDKGELKHAPGNIAYDLNEPKPDLSDLTFHHDIDNAFGLTDGIVEKTIKNMAEDPKHWNVVNDLVENAKQNHDGVITVDILHRESSENGALITYSSDDANININNMTGQENSEAFVAFSTVRDMYMKNMYESKEIKDIIAKNDMTASFVRLACTAYATSVAMEYLTENNAENGETLLERAYAEDAFGTSAYNDKNRGNKYEKFDYSPVIKATQEAVDKGASPQEIRMAAFGEFFKTGGHTDLHRSLQFVISERPLNEGDQAKRGIIGNMQPNANDPMLDKNQEKEHMEKIISLLPVDMQKTLGYFDNKDLKTAVLGMANPFEEAVATTDLHVRGEFDFVKGKALSGHGRDEWNGNIIPNIINEAGLNYNQEVKEYNKAMAEQKTEEQKQQQPQPTSKAEQPKQTTVTSEDVVRHNLRNSLTGG